VATGRQETANGFKLGAVKVVVPVEPGIIYRSLFFEGSKVGHAQSSCLTGSRTVLR
jgi:hypothetical protein